MTSKRNLAATVGRWSSRHRKTAILGWIAFVAIAYMLGGNGMKTLTQQQAGVGDSGQASKLYFDHTPKADEEMVILTNKKASTDSPQFKAAIADVRSRLAHTAGVHDVTAPGDPHTGPNGAVSPNHHTALVSFKVPGEYETPSVKKIVDATVLETKAADRAHPGYIIEQFGDGSSEKAFQAIFAKDLSKATTLSLPLTLLILLVAFGTLLAAGLPLLLAITGVLATLGLVGPLSHLTPVDDSIRHVILLIGLAVGVDYSLFYLRRMREEKAAGRTRQEAIDAAAATSGRAVLVSGMTVITAMAGMYFAGAPMFTSFATGSITVVAVAMLGSLTVLPAMMSLMGDRIEKTRVPGLNRLKARIAKLDLWGRAVDRVMRRPALAASLAVALLVAMAIPAIGINTGNPPLGDSLPKDEPVVQTFNRLRDAFPTETSAMTIVVKAKDVTRPAVTAGIAKLQDTAAKQPVLFPGKDRPDVEVTPDHRVATVSLETAGDGTGKDSAAALDALRDEVIPSTIGSVSGVSAYVGGQTAEDRDFNDTMIKNLPIVFGFVLLAAFLLLLATFRSIVVPIKAIVLNLLSVFASYGVLVLVFQHGWFKSLLGFSDTGPIVAWLPMFLFVILFGLSMDYHVFILSRIKELVDRGTPTDEAVKATIKSTAGVVTSAAVVMVGVFALFGTLHFMVFKQMGVGLAIAVLLDATIIRGVLLPTSMAVLGERNWWLPKSLGWLPKVATEAPAPKAVPEPA
jgi:uncharacterized membrane protein YdfJ with MMPL/SSD domain